MDYEVQCLDSLDTLQQSVAFKPAFVVLKGKAFGVPNLSDMQELLKLFKDAILYCIVDL